MQISGGTGRTQDDQSYQEDGTHGHDTDAAEKRGQAMRDTGRHLQGHGQERKRENDKEERQEVEEHGILE